MTMNDSGLERYCRIVFLLAILWILGVVLTQQMDDNSSVRKDHDCV